MNAGQKKRQGNLAKGGNEQNTRREKSEYMATPSVAQAMVKATHYINLPLVVVKFPWVYKAVCVTGLLKPQCGPTQVFRRVLDLCLFALSALQ